MKFLLLAALTLSSVSVFADHHEMKEEMKKKWDSMSFEDAKKMSNEMLAKKKAMLDEVQSCVDKAKDKDALKECKEEAREAKHEMHKEMKKKFKKK